MKSYNKPEFEFDELELTDVILTSLGTNDGVFPEDEDPFMIFD